MTTVATVGEFMAKELVTVHPEMDAYEAITLLLKHKISGMPVVDDKGDFVGILSERDCLNTLLDSEYHELPSALVKDLMSTDVESVTPETDILTVAERFLRKKYRRLPVLAGGRLVGQISRRDILRAIQEMH